MTTLLRVAHTYPRGHYRHREGAGVQVEVMPEAEARARALGLQHHGAEVTVGPPIVGEPYWDGSAWWTLTETGQRVWMWRRPEGQP
ncbi:MAG: hypothetical protein ACO26C_08385 [Ilumatobacteraceae bacterium]